MLVGFLFGWRTNIDQRVERLDPGALDVGQRCPGPLQSRAGLSHGRRTRTAIVADVEDTLCACHADRGVGRASRRRLFCHRRAVRQGVVRDQTELARLAKVTQPRMTQILNLLHLAPDIQEELLHLPRVKIGKDPITERDLRPIAAEVDWGRQRELWRRPTEE